MKVNAIAIFLMFITFFLATGAGIAYMVHASDHNDDAKRVAFRVLKWSIIGFVIAGIVAVGF